MKRHFNLKKLMKVDSTFLFTRKNDELALISKNGVIGMLTNDPTVFIELERLGCILEQANIYDTVHNMVFAKEMNESMRRSGITVSVLNAKNAVAYIGEGLVKLMDTRLDEIFDPRMTVTSHSYQSPMLYVCEDCYGLVCPVCPLNMGWLSDMRQITLYFGKGKQHEEG